MTTIGIIEDDKQLNHAIKLLLEKNGYKVFQAYCVHEGIQMIKQENIQILLLDIGLPDGEGFEIYKYFSKDTNVSVIFLTAKDDEVDMIKAYDSGCEDYIVKPFSMKILLKRIEVVLRRNENKSNVLKYNHLEMNVDRREVKVSGTPIALTNNEFDVLHLLMRNKNRVISKTLILESVWDAKEQYVDESSVTVTISRLRKKLDKNSKAYIKNVFGSGYHFGD
ncbi:DNA-binding response OmpR family regulator [Breznakia sp. PF5-3]|uniref:response regulator transcription factor n=1 Tax=unclassified Breznakia TaxID=2623764 RepID=UPI002405443F|nr:MULTISPECIES: response regulator transcription factor [unclassified Breznakia]MDF9825699.1 DNA-binding response OmpR family regulator [Breznakia sp. PM6-1]MDF9836539.1 DNA-binding response OmpR family regulator [Breznakia sp. PF5-3]MDF9838773.1 DNA-binding response OmpR family regulator [Breznakia sp. PFB2-8]MDF9860799.1 DNA-binding response OmpR family regulator [Breznakia sp. PH5-24]